MNAENNKLIAEFLHGKNAIHPNLYHENWDEIMQVVKKAGQTENAYENEYFLLIRDELCTGRIETVYDAVVNFIIEYNNQKK